jgi:GT2 family glycosyltransferase
MIAAAPAPVLRIGILTYNGLDHTRRCLESLIAHTTVPWRALVRDNASADETPNYLQSIGDPRIVAYCGADNLGVGGGRNWLLDQLLPDMQDNDLLVLLDNDIEVAPGWEIPFLEAFAEHPRLGVAGRWAFSMIVHDRWRDILSENSSEPGPVDTVQGCCFWLRGAAARAIGHFDTSLGRFWHEDDDYSIRALVAGWDVRRVPTSAMTHHEHGSGVALNADKVIGSARNQRYLIDKWRALGAIDDDGIPRRPIPDAQRPVHEALAARLGRPLVRTEVNSALVDATLLLHAPVSDARVGLLASPLARLLLADATQVGGETAKRASAAAARIDTLLAARRAPAAGTSSAPARAFSAICTPDAWDDPRWEAIYRTVLWDGSGRDFYARSETGWRDGQLLYALRALGALRRTAQVLVIGHPAERLIAALSHHVEAITVCDREAHPQDAIERYAQRPLGDARVELRSWAGVAGNPSRALFGSASAFDAVLCPNFSRFAAAADFGLMLRHVARPARAGAVVGVAVSVRIAGPANGRWVEPEQLADDDTLHTASLRRVGAMDRRVSDETLLAAVPEDAPPSFRPRLARVVGPHVATLATLVSRRC